MPAGRVLEQEQPLLFLELTPAGQAVVDHLLNILEKNHNQQREHLYQADCAEVVVEGEVQSVAAAVWVLAHLRRPGLP